MSGDFKPEEFTDAYREALQQVIDVKVGKKDTVVQPTTEEPIAPTIDLMAALRESVERARAARGGSPEERRHATVTPIKKAAKAEAEEAEPKKATKAAKKAAPAKAEPKKAAESKKSTAAKKTTTAKKTPARKAKAA